MKQEVKRIEDLTIGSKLLYRSKQDWRTASIARIDDDTATLTVCSPTGRTYRLRRKKSCEVLSNGPIFILRNEEFDGEIWNENFGAYDTRW